MITATKPFIPPIEGYTNLVEEIFKNKWFTNHGPFVTSLEKELQKHFGTEHLLLVSNGTIALQLAIKALDLKGKIITTPYSYVATTTSILWEQCEPVFVDISPNTFNADPACIEKAITPDTSAILVTNVYGIPCDFEAIQKLADAHGLKVIYDNAHGFGTKMNGCEISLQGDISTLSFHATKLFHSIEGGAIVCKDKAVFERMKLLRNFGHTSPTTFGDIGINGKMNEFCAAMGLLNFGFLEDILEKRKTQWLYYKENLTGTNYAIFDDGVVNGEFNYAYFPLLFKDEQSLLAKMESMEADGISVRRYFFPSLNTLSYLKNLQNCPVSEDISKRVICLPLYHELTIEEQDKILAHFKN